MRPLAQPGELTETERFLFDAWGYLVVENALSQDEVSACLDAADRLHAPNPPGQWRQIGNSFEKEPAMESLIDHSSVIQKARALLGDRFILHSSWCTMVPAGFKGGGFHQDGSSAYDFRKLATPVPLVQLRVGYILTEQPTPGYGNMVMIPGTHNASVPLPRGANVETMPIAHIITGKPGDALLFHQAVYHCGMANNQNYDRHMIHMVYAPPWLRHSDRMNNSPEFLERLTPMRRALMGMWTYPEESFHMRPLPFKD
ncbi:MAG: phytanoyl-CoA dioxygenase family protein [Candidatus Poribacteria bacterium]|nr:phytanoyl-CoA dioxygenase family protein [Candidatus Poribacteria bacterium]